MPSVIFIFFLICVSHHPMIANTFLLVPPAFRCNSPNRDSEWAAWVIFWAAARHNKQNGRPKKLFFILFQIPARTRACSLPETRPLHWSLQIDCRSIQQITLANGKVYDKIHLARHVIVVYLISASGLLLCILYFPIPYNALCLPPKFCINCCCEMLSGICLSHHEGLNGGSTCRL